MPIIRSSSYISDAVNRLKNGNLVAFPTETVYGLGADATNQDAIIKIYTYKKRPIYNPLIVHFSDKKMAEKYAYFNQLAHKLTKAFWPGPLTLILPKIHKYYNPIYEGTTAGLSSIAVRVPSHPIAHEILVRVKTPIAAPSANKSGYISPTTAQHVANSLFNIDFIIDGGPSNIGLESTVIDLTTERAIILRPGYITQEEIQEVIDQDIFVLDSTIKNNKPKSPGLLYRHYAPKKPIRINAISAQKQSYGNEILLGFNAYTCNTDGFKKILWISKTGSLYEAATQLFSKLYIADKSIYDYIAISPIPNYGIGIAINDRIKRATNIN